MSEYYALRRRGFKDITGLIFFVIGWFASAPLGWPYITGGFENGEVTKGVAIFLVVVFGAACLMGIAGLLLGSAAGWGWEQAHRRWRRRHAPAPAVPARAPDSAAARPRVTGQPLPALRFETNGVRVDDYIELAQRVAPADYDARKSAAALERTTNIAAWDGTRLVGVVRLLTDGYFFAAVPDILVDPEYQRRGLGRELMNRAFERTPRGSLFVGARAGSAVFFDRIGCEPGPSGFTMRRTSKARG